MRSLVDSQKKKIATELAQEKLKRLEATQEVEYKSLENQAAEIKDMDINNTVSLRCGISEFSTKDNH